MENPLFKKIPKIGIRPAIDGRLGGVRESLESQTMNLAQSVAKLITEELRYLTISNALQWRLQYTRVIAEAGKVAGIVRVK